MIQALRQLVTFDEFVAKYPDNTGKRYELYDGVIVEMPQPTGDHQEMIVFLVQKFILEYSRISLRYGIPKTVLVKPLESESAYSPDVLILNLPNLVNEPVWKKESTVSQAESIPLVVEVVSSNWRDDYLKKAADYEAVGIPKYWIVDYAALGGRRFIGNPKQPTVSLYTLIEGEYHIKSASFQVAMPAAVNNALSHLFSQN